jgi:lysophospholipid acyltransferase 5
MPDFVDALAASVGMAAPGLRILVSLLLQYPLAVGMAQLATSGAAVKHAYAALSGAALLYFNFGPTMAHNVFTVLVTWLALAALPRKAAVGFVFVFQCAYLLVGYWFVSTDGYDVDWTLPQCILCLRLIGLAWDVFDGGKDVSTLRTDQLANHIVDTPGLLEVFGFALFFPTILTGPQLPFSRYRAFVANKLSDVVDRSAIAPARLQAAAWRAAAGRLLLGAVYLAAVTVLEGLFPASLLQELTAMPLWRAIAVLTVIGNVGLRKYIGIWLINEGSCIVSGIALDLNDGVKGKATDVSQINFGAAANVLPYLFETATNINHKIGSFNINTNDWTKRYVFKRLMWVGNKDVSTIAALTFLSLWHGFKAGYAFTFSFEFVALLLQQRIIARHIQLGLDKSAIYAGVVCYTAVVLISGYAYVPFITNTWEKTVSMFSGVSWYYHAIVVGWLAVELALESTKAKPKTPKEAKKAD